jgi:hypothetical protein
MKKNYFLFSFLFFCFTAHAQQFSKEDSLFFQREHHTLKRFFEQSNIKLEKSTLEIVRDKGKEYLVLHLYINSGGDWLKIRETFFKEYQQSIEKYIFDKLIFSCEILPEQALLYVQTEQKRYLVAGIDTDTQNFNIQYLNTDLSIDKEENFLKETARAVVSYPFSVPHKGFYEEGETEEYYKNELILKIKWIYFFILKKVLYLSYETKRRRIQIVTRDTTKRKA